MRPVPWSGMRALLCAVAIAAANPALALSLDAVVDNCASFLGSLSRELHFARALAPGQRTSFTCPRERETRSAIGASRERVLRALGTPDATGADADGALSWTYVFASRVAGDRLGSGGAPQLAFHFGPGQDVASVSCDYGR